MKFGGRRFHPYPADKGIKCSQDLVPASKVSNVLCISSKASIFLKILGFYIERDFMKGEKEGREKEWG